MTRHVATIVILQRYGANLCVQGDFIFPSNSVNIYVAIYAFYP